MIKLLYASLLFEKPLWSIGFVKLDQNRKVDRRIIGNYRNSETLMPGISHIDAWHVLFGWRQCNRQSVFICLHVWRMLGVAQGIREAMAVECCVHIRHSFLSTGNLLVTVPVRDVGMSRAVDLSKENYIKCYTYTVVVLDLYLIIWLIFYNLFLSSGNAMNKKSDVDLNLIWCRPLKMKVCSRKVCLVFNPFANLGGEN